MPFNNMEGDSMSVEDASKLTGQTPRELGEGLGAFAAGDKEINRDDLENYMEEYNPEEVDFSTHTDHSIEEHPEYEERYNELVDKYKRKQLQNDPYDLYDDWYEDYQNSEKYQEAQQEAMKEAREEAAKEHYGELYASSHQDDRFIPEHLRSHIPNIEEIKSKRKRAIGEPTDVLDKHLPKKQNPKH